MRKVLAIGAVLLVAALLAGWFFGRPAYKRYKERHWLRMAQSFMASKDYKAAGMSVMQVLKRNPANVEACRIGVRLSEMAGSPDLLGWRKRLAELEPSVDNKLALAAAALRREPPPFALTGQALDEIRTKAPDRAAFHIISAERSLRLRMAPEAIHSLQEAVRLDPTNQLYALNLAVLQLESAEPKVADQAHSTLERLSSDRQLGAAALRSLRMDAVKKKNLPAALEFSDRLIRDTNSAFADRIQHLGLVRSVRNADFESELAAAKQAAGADPRRLAELGSWMNAQGMFNESVAWLKTVPPAVQNQPPVAVVLAHGYLLQKDWRTLQKTLKAQKWAEQDFMRFGFLAWASRAEGDEGMTTSYWKRAGDAAAERQEFIAGIVNAAQTWGWSNEVEQLLWQTARKFPAENWPLEALERIYYRAGATKYLLRVYAARLERRPKDPIAQNDLAAVSLLLKTNVPRARTLALDAYTATQTNSMIAATYAFALYMQGKSKEGLAVLDKFQTNQLEVPSIALCYALLLNATGETERAKHYRTLAEGGRLLPEERSLLTK